MELKDNTVQSFSSIVVSSLRILAVFYIVMTSYGFLAFGSNSDGFIINNYSTQDPIASICRFAIAVAIIFTYPLPFIGVRDGILGIFEVPTERQTPAFKLVITTTILATFTIIAVQFDDLGLVNAVGGGSLGTLVVFVFPSLMFRAQVRTLGDEASSWQKHEAFLVVGLMWVGIFMGSVGVWVSIKGV